MSKPKEISDGENLYSLQLRIQELEAENAKLLWRLSNCTCSQKQKKPSSSVVKFTESSYNNGIDSISGGSMTKKKKPKEKPSEMVSFFSNLPVELLVEIMSWLPPKSLLRFKSVSKSWNFLLKNIIKDPTFVAKHLQHSSSSSKSILFVGDHFCHCEVKTRKFKGFSLLNLLSDDNVDDQIQFFTEKLSPLPIPTDNFASEGAERCHCDGIFFLFNWAPYFGSWDLCNPATKELKLLPPTSLTKVVYGAGFGYDSRGHDYKVVVFGVDYSKHVRDEVYCLSTHAWREINHSLDVATYPYKKHNYAYLQGVSYWLFSRERILSFDMCNEVFQSISTPKDGYNALTTNMRLTVWNESVAMIYSSSADKDGHMTSYEIWVMDNCHDSVTGLSSWNKVLTIGPLVKMGNALDFWKNDELLIKNRASMLCSYNIHSKKLREIRNHMAKHTYYWSFSYARSLVSLQGRK